MNDDKSNITAEKKGFSSEFPYSVNYEIKPLIKQKKPSGYVSRDTVEAAREHSAGYQGKKEMYKGPNPGTRPAAYEADGREF